MVAEDGVVVAVEIVVVVVAVGKTVADVREGVGATRGRAGFVERVCFLGTGRGEEIILW